MTAVLGEPDMPLTTPDPFTDATPVLLLVQVPVPGVPISVVVVMFGAT